MQWPMGGIEQQRPDTQWCRLTDYLRNLYSQNIRLRNIDQLLQCTQHSLQTCVFTSHDINGGWVH